MKIGTSLSRCVADIYTGKININDVMVIVARTDFNPEDDGHWKSIWRGYAGGGTVVSISSNPEWSNIPSGDEQAVRNICISLKKQGKLHQPRQFGAYPQRMTHHWYDLILSESVLDSTPSAKEAWENYKLVAGLSQ